jgi:hypothetical protein
MLKILPDMVKPVSSAQINALMDGLVQLNLIEGCLSEQQQRALSVDLSCFDLYIKSKGKWDYRFAAGHQRLFQDAATFCGSGTPIATRKGDLAASHLALDFSDTQVRLAQAGLPLLPTNVSDLLINCRDMCGLTVIDEHRIGVLLDYLSKKSPPA